MLKYSGTFLHLGVAQCVTSSYILLSKTWRPQSTFWLRYYNKL